MLCVCMYVFVDTVKQDFFQKKLCSWCSTNLSLCIILFRVCYSPPWAKTIILASLQAAEQCCVQELTLRLVGESPWPPFPIRFWVLRSRWCTVQGAFLGLCMWNRPLNISERSFVYALLLRIVVELESVCFHCAGEKQGQKAESLIVSSRVWAKSSGVTNISVRFI